MKKQLYGKGMPVCESDKVIYKLMNLAGLTTRWELDEDGYPWPDMLHEVGLLYARIAFIGTAAIAGIALRKNNKKKRDM